VLLSSSIGLSSEPEHIPARVGAGEPGWGLGVAPGKSGFTEIEGI